MKRWAPRLAFRKRLKVIWKWPIICLQESHKLNVQLTENVIALSQPVGFKAEAVNEGVWCACTVEEESNDQ